MYERVASVLLQETAGDMAAMLERIRDTIQESLDADEKAAADVPSPSWVSGKQSKAALVCAVQCCEYSAAAVECLGCSIPQSVQRAQACLCCVPVSWE